MFPVSERFLANLPVARWVPKLEWALGGSGEWNDLTLLDGSVSANAASQVRWSGSFTVTDVEVGRFALSPYGCRLRAMLGMAFGPDDIEWLPMGIYRVETVERSVQWPEKVMITGASLESQIIDDRFITPQVFAPQPAASLLERLIIEAVPDAVVSWRDDLNTPLPQLVADKDRWAVIDGSAQKPSIARALGARVYCDSRGIFVVRAVATFDDAPVWTADTGSDGLLVTATETLTRDGVFNIIVATGASTDGQPPAGPGIAADTAPTSPTRIDGPFGRVPLFYSSPLLLNQAYCEVAAQGLLQPYLGLRQQVSAEVMNPALRPGDVVNIRMPDGELQPNILDGVNFSLTGGDAGLTTRTSAIHGTIYTPPTNISDITITPPPEEQVA